MAGGHGGRPAIPAAPGRGGEISGIGIASARFVLE
jgi:hypothetical protein